MSKKIKIWLIIAAALVLTGTIILGSVMTMFKWDFTKLSPQKYKAEYEINEKYKNISISTKTANILFVASEGDRTSVVCNEEKNMKHSVTVEGDTLVIELIDTRKWYEYISFNFFTPQITVNIPKGEYGALTVNTSTGDIEIPEDFKFRSIDICETTGDIKNCASALENIKIKTTTGGIQINNTSAEAIELSTSTGGIEACDVVCNNGINIAISTGKANLSNIKCKKFESSGSTGDICLKNVIATEGFKIERSTGNVKLDLCDANEIFVKTSTGNVTGSLLNDKIFFTKTSTGSIDIPKTTSGGKCEIITSTGNIKIDIIP